MHKRSALFLGEAFSDRGSSEGSACRVWTAVSRGHVQSHGLSLAHRLPRRPVGEFLFKYSRYIPEHVF